MKTFLIRVMQSIAVPSVLLFLWFSASIQDNYNLVPSPFVTADYTIKLLYDVSTYSHILATVCRVIIGTGISLLLALILATIRNKSVYKFISPLILIGLGVPSLVMSYLLIMIIGVGSVTIIVVIISSVTPLLTIQLTNSLNSVSNESINMITRTYRPPQIVVIKKIIIPQLTLFITSSIRTGISVSWKVAIIAESFAINTGIGYMIKSGFQIFSLKAVLSWTIIFVILMAIPGYAFKKIDDSQLKWKQ